MRSELHHIEEIENYLEGKMTSSDKKEFEQRMAAFPSLAASVALQRDLTSQVKVDAFRKEIAAFGLVAGAAVPKSMWKGFFLNSFLTIIIAGSATAGIYYYTQKNQAPEKTLMLQSDPKEEVVAPSENIIVEESEDTRDDQPANKKSTTITSFAPIRTGGKIEPVVLPEPQPYADESPCKHFQVQFEKNEIDAEKGGTVVMKESNSLITIPASILVDENGNEVKGKVEIRYREYRNSAETAFSGIPMTYKQDNEELNMNSAGMFEIRAYQNNKPVNIKPGKAITVDYVATNKIEDCNFYALNDEKQEWKQINKINFQQDQGMNQGSPDNFVPPADDYGQIFLKIKDAETGEIIENAFVDFNTKVYKHKYKNIYIDSGFNVSKFEAGNIKFRVKAEGYKPIYARHVRVEQGKAGSAEVLLARKKHFYQIRKKSLSGKFDQKNEFVSMIPVKGKHIGTRVKKDRDKVRERDNDNDFNEAGPIGNRNVRGENGFVMKDNGNRKDGTLLGDGRMNDAGHTYPNMVRGLQCESFGVYNCDQVMRLADRIMVNAKYIDENGNPISNQHVLSMIDMKYNGAFSFDPRYFTCSQSGRNVLLLFTRDKKLYALSEEAYKKMDIKDSGDFTFKMTDITEEVKSPSELKKYLGIK